jgi:hypothetical protein
VARARGHRRYYAGILRGHEAQIVRRYDGELKVLAAAPFPPGATGWHDLTLAAERDTLTLSVGNQLVLTAKDDAFTSGGAGFVVNTGSIVADGVHIGRLAVENGPAA